MSDKVKFPAGIQIECEAPEVLAHVMYAMLTDENKEKVNQKIAQLIAEQS